MKTLIIGDIHGAWGNGDDVIEAAIRDHGIPDRIIQVGDMGFGFPGVRPWETEHAGIKKLWIDGNHENFDMLHKRHLPNFGHDPYHVLWPGQWKNFLERWEYVPRGTARGGILFIGGASSIDRQFRTPGLDWWGEENILYSDQEQVYAAIESATEPIHTVISHDCPTGFVMAPMLYGKEYRDGNRMFLEEIRQIVKPSRWYFGHYHCKYGGTLDGCEWRCLNMAPSGDYEYVEL